MNGDTVNLAGGYAFVVAKNRNGPEGSKENDDGTGNSLTILDIHTNPAEPSIVGSVHDANSLFGAYGVAVSGNYAYVAAQGCLGGQPCPNPSVGNDLDVIEIAGPGAPKIVATLRNPAEPSVFGHVTSVAVSGNYAYLTAFYQHRLTVVDISNPLSPKLVTSLDDPTHFTYPADVAISGNYAYVINQGSAGPLVAVDIGNPAEPKVAGSLSSPELSGGYRVRLRGGMAYVAASERAGIAVADISNPLSPRLLASYVDPQHLHFTTGLDLDEGGSHVIATSTYLPGQHQPLYPPYALETGGPELDGSVSVITLDPLPIRSRNLHRIGARRDNLANIGELRLLRQRRRRHCPVPVGHRSLDAVHHSDQPGLHATERRLAQLPGPGHRLRRQHQHRQLQLDGHGTGGRRRSRWWWRRRRRKHRSS